ncbi:MAG: hypothetical protein QG564_1847 [Campylobacterota bacterium]|nr:hypothetical protein [Campylobacterota bacterium]
MDKNLLDNIIDEYFLKNEIGLINMLRGKQAPMGLLEQILEMQKQQIEEDILKEKEHLEKAIPEAKSTTKKLKI